MRKVTQSAAQALKNQKTFKSGNTRVDALVDELLYGLYLHGNKIAEYDAVTGNIYISDCGWRTNTTKERINGILQTFGIPAHIYQKDYNWYLGYKDVSVLWTGEYSFSVSQALINQ